MAIISLSFTAPDVALVADVQVSGQDPRPLVLLVPDVSTEIEGSFVASQNTYTTLSGALSAAQAIDPNYDPNNIYGNLEVSVTSDGYIEALAGDTIQLTASFSAVDPGATLGNYQWHKEGKEIYGANSVVLSGTYASTMAGNYTVSAEATLASTGQTGAAVANMRLATQIPPLYAADALGAQDPYGIINTGRGGGVGSGGPDDLNPSFITLIDTTYAVSDLELYVPTTSTVISYDGGLTPPFTFDSSGNCFNGTDYEMEIRVAATSLVLATVTVPDSLNNANIYWY